MTTEELVEYIYDTPLEEIKFDNTPQKGERALICYLNTAKLPKEI
ncbi:hypothetical protein [Lactococcus petauri]|nr:hypothetical protein [Lactococcus petauri]